MVAVFGGIYGFDEDTVYLSPAPLYHAAPLRYVGIVGATGGTAVIMPRFDPEQALINIEKFKVTHSQRSEEHTSELQSLMRISYAVFCLKKKIKHVHTSHRFNYHLNAH